MPKSSIAKWRKVDEVRLKNLVKRFNAKIRRVEKNRPELSALQPPKENLKALRETLKGMSRVDINYQFKKMENYLKKGAELPYTTKQGVNTTVWEKKEIDRAVRTLNARNKALIQKYEPSTTKGTMGTIERNNLQPRKNRVNTIQPKDYNRYVSNLFKQVMQNDVERNERYKENFLKAVENIMGENSKLYQVVKNMDSDLLTKYYYTEPLLQLTFVYDPKDAEEIENLMLERLEQLQGK